MSTRVTIPQLSANITEATVTEWLVAEGASVTPGQAVAEVTTDKAAFELESPARGSLLRIFAREKSIVPVGYAVALVGTPGEVDETVEADNQALLDARRDRPPAAARQRSRAGGARVRATPRARKLARAHDIDLARVKAETGADLINEKILAPYLEDHA